MATVRRLSDSDVRTIFECLHQKQRPPSRLKFKIVPVKPGGLRLSPPNYEFEDGLYILLRPLKEKKNEVQPRAPSHLLDCVMKDFPPDTCSWSLSGPQFPQPTAIQQRYCYPKGDPHYCSRKGGALWTMYGLNGKEDTEYRLLHVYFSAKRAVNKGVTIDEEDRALLNDRSSPATKTPSPRKRCSKRARLSAVEPKRQQLQQQQNLLSPPMSTATTTSSFCPSPLSFADHGSYLSRGGSLDGMDSNFVTPNSSMGANIHVTGGAFDEGRFHPVHSPFRPRVLLPTTPTRASRKLRLQPPHPSPLRSDKDDDEHDDDDNDDFALALPTDHTVTSNLEPFPCDMMDDVCLNLDDDVEDDWSHPQSSNGEILSVVHREEPWKSLPSWSTPRQNYQSQQNHHQNHHANNQRHHNHHRQQAQLEFDERLRLFEDGLLGLHQRFRSMILSAPEPDQGPLLSILCYWAKQVAQNPLSQPKTTTETNDNGALLKSSTTASV